ncbi:MAG: lipid-A-disaccharide synthase [bacterium]
MTFKIVISAAETSGDLLAGSLIKNIRQQFPDVEFYGITGNFMRSSGCISWFDVDEISVMGFSEVIKQLPRLLKLRRDFINKTLIVQPDLYIGVDAPDFNFPIEKKLNKADIPVVHYVSPSVWAWRTGRTKQFTSYFDLILCLFPFEPEIYEQYKINALFTGHPFADEIPITNTPNIAKQIQYPDQITIALLPGSRNQEINKLAAILFESAKLIIRQYPNVKFTTCFPNRAKQRLFDSYQKKYRIHIQSSVGNTREILKQADLALVSSGTVTLEALLCGCPAIVIYKVSKLTAFILRTFKLIHSKWVSLPNVLAQDDLVPELLQEDANPSNISNHAISMLKDKERRQKILNAYHAIHKQLAVNSAETAAKHILHFIKSR